MKELSLRPYTGKCYFVRSKTEYHKAHEDLFVGEDILTCNIEGRMCAGEGKDGYWTYLVYANKPHYLAHEMAHVVFHVFERAGINPTDSAGEAFCYMLSHLMLEATNGRP